MTQLDELLARTAIGEVQGLSAEEAVRRLFDVGLIDRRRCERLAIRREVGELQRCGTPRCEAFEITARKYCCSYEKARNAFYDKSF